MSEFIRPQVTVEGISESFARFTVEPLERGFGDTLGNSLRRVLLSSLDGAAVEAIHIEGVQHEFQSLAGVGEDFFVPAEFDLINPEHVIATLEDGVHFTMSMRIGTGRGYAPGESNARGDDSIGIIHVDSLFSPVRRCTKFVEPCRVGQRTDYDRLVLEVETNGAVTPTEALVQAANIVNQHINAFLTLTTVESVPEETSIFAQEEPVDNVELDKRIDDLDLSVRSFNCLKRAGIHSVRQLLDFSENDLLNIRNFGVKSIEEVKDKLDSMGMSLKQ